MLSIKHRYFDANIKNPFFSNSVILIQLSILGFTALGLRRKHYKKLTNNSSRGINGVLFPVRNEAMESFDIREVGYDRVEIPLKYVTPHESLGHPLAQKRTVKFRELQKLAIEGMGVLSSSSSTTALLFCIFYFFSVTANNK